MPQYRIEVSPNNRAGCKDTECKKRADKITKGNLRFGSWVEIQDHGSWAWKHWGCVSGAQLSSLQELCDKGDGSYDFDMIDGYDELPDADLRTKVERCVKQGHIDPEDFNGDPEKNKPGEKGIHLTAAQKRKKEAAAAADGDGDSAPKKAKRGRKQADDDDGEEEEPKPKKTKKTKATKAEESEEEKPTPSAKPARGKRVSAAKKIKDDSESEDGEEEEKPAPVAKGRKATAKKAKDESAKEAPAPAKRGRKPAAKKAASPVTDEEADEEEEKPAPKAKGRRGGSVKEAAPQAQPVVKARRGRPRKV